MSDIVDRLLAYARLREFRWLIEVADELVRLRREVERLRKGT